MDQGTTAPEAAPVAKEEFSNNNSDPKTDEKPLVSEPSIDANKSETEINEISKVKIEEENIECKKCDDS